NSLDRPTHNDMARSAIFDALADLEDENSWDVLVAGAEYGAPKHSRSSAMRALSRLAKRYERRKGEALQYLTRFAKETRGTLAAVFRGKIGAVQAMKTLDDLAAIPVLRELVENETDPRLRRMAEETIGSLRESAKKPREIGKIRSELDDVVKESKALRDRLNLLENKEEAANKSSSAGHKRKKRAKRPSQAGAANEG
ncbi:MAG: hypothetical protein ACE5GQ_09000, partial [Nitrospinales bacterium]